MNLFDDPVLRDVLDEDAKIRELGDKALLSLQEAKNYLESIGNLDVLDVLGGGLFSNVSKRNDINKAKSSIMLAQRDLKRFFEVAGEDGDEDISRFVHDNFMADISASRRINRALMQIDEAEKKVKQLLNKR